MNSLSPFLFRSALGAAALLGTAHAASTLPTPDADNAGLTLPAGFHAIVVADGVDGVRHIVVGANGDIYGKLRGGGVMALRDTDGDGRADIKQKIAEDCPGGTGIGIHDGYLYYSSNTAVFRQKLTPGELAPSGPVETVIHDLPDRMTGGRPQHEAKGFAFDNEGHIYVECGSPSNALGNPDRSPNAVGASPEAIDAFLQKHGGFWRFDANKLNQTQADGTRFSTGHRHMFAIAFHPTSRALFGCQNGRDVLNVVDKDTFTDTYNAEHVSEEFHVIREDSNFGWPTTYYDPIDKVRLLSPEYGGDGKKRPPAGRFQDPLVAFPAHWAPMAMAIYTGTQFPAKYRGGAFVTFHGSWNRAPVQRGFNVSFVPFDERGMPRGGYEVFADGFAGAKELKSPGDAKYRPMGVAMGPDGSLYVGADQGSRVWRIFYTGQ